MTTTKQPSEKALAAAREWLIKNVAPAKPTASPPFVGYTIAGKVDAVEGLALALDAFAAEAVKAEREACIEVCAVIADNVDNDVRAPHMVEQGYRPLGIGREIRKHAAAIRARGKE